MLITVTSIRLRSVWYFFKLSWLGLKISRQAKKQAGFIQLKNTGFGYLHHTLTAWENEESLKNFAYSAGEHLEAMKQSQALSTEIRTYTYAADAVPQWAEAKKLLLEKGKLLTYK